MIDHPAVVLNVLSVPIIVVVRHQVGADIDIVIVTNVLIVLHDVDIEIVNVLKKGKIGRHHPR